LSGVPLTTFAKGHASQKTCELGCLKNELGSVLQAPAFDWENVMEAMNGTANGKTTNGKSANGKIDVRTFFTELAELAKPAKNPPANEFRNGRVVTRVWAKCTHWGEIRWQVDHYRKSEAAESGKQFSLEPCDLQDAMRGLYQAQRWIKQTERRRSRGFWSW